MMKPMRLTVWWWKFVLHHNYSEAWILVLFGFGQQFSISDKTRIRGNQFLSVSL